MINWNHLQYVLALKDGGTMKEAAMLLKTDPTTVSRNIKSISASLGTSLFLMEKSGRWVPTPTGERFILLAQDFKTGIDSLKNADGADKESNTVTVTSLDFFLTHYIAPNLGAKIPGFPEVSLNLVASERRLSLAYGEADIALRFGRPVQGQLVASKVASISYHVYAATGARPTQWIGLREELDEMVDMQMGFHTFGCPPQMRVSSYVAAREAALATGFAAIGPAIVMQKGGGLKPLADVKSVSRDVWSVIHETRQFSKRLKATRDWLKATIALNQERFALQLDSERQPPMLKSYPCNSSKCG